MPEWTWVALDWTNAWLWLAYLWAGIACYMAMFKPMFYRSLVKSSKYPRLVFIRHMLFVIVTWPIMPFCLAYIYLRLYSGRLFSRVIPSMAALRDWYRARKWYRTKRDYFGYSDETKEVWYRIEKYATRQEAVAEAIRELGHAGPTIYTARLRHRKMKGTNKKKREWVPRDVESHPTRLAGSLAPQKKGVTK